MSDDTPPLEFTRTLATAEETNRLGRALAHACRIHASEIARLGLQVNLRGDLGVGKTALVRGWLRAFGIRGPIRSPTFAVLESYGIPLMPEPAVGRGGLEPQPTSSLDFYHFDFYRFADPAEFIAAGFRDEFGAGRIGAIEWPEKAGDRLPAADIEIALHLDGDSRRAVLRAATALGRACLVSAVKEFDSHDAA